MTVKRLQRLIQGIPIGISAMALILSVVTTYFSLLRVSDDVRVLIDHFPFVTLNSKDRNLEISRATNFLFINAGTRTISINQIFLQVIQPTDGAPFDKDCRRGDVEFGWYDVTPFVLKPGEMVSKDAIIYVRVPTNLKGATVNATVEEMSNWPVTLRGDNKGKAKVQYQLCVGVGLTTPDADRRIVISRFEQEVDASVVGYTDYRPDEVQPIQIIKRSSILFWN